MNELLLMQELAASLYARLIMEAAKHLGPTHAFYSLWPTAELQQPWAALVKAFYEQVSFLRPLLTQHIRPQLLVCPPAFHDATMSMKPAATCMCLVFGCCHPDSEADY